MNAACTIIRGGCCRRATSHDIYIYIAHVALYFRNRALQCRKRAIYFRTRTLYIRKRTLSIWGCSHRTSRHHWRHNVLTTFVYVYWYAHANVYSCSYIFRRYTVLFMCVCVWIRPYIHIFMFLHIWVICGMCIFACPYIQIFMYLHTWAIYCIAHMRMYVDMSIHEYFMCLHILAIYHVAHMCMNIYMSIYTYIHIPTYMGDIRYCSYAYVFLYVHTYIYIYIHVPTYIGDASYCPYVHIANICSIWIYVCMDI